MAALSNSLGKMFPHAVGDKELRIFGPAVKTLRQPDLIFAKRLPMCATGVLLVRSPVGDMAVHDDERGPVVGVVKHIESALQHIEIVGIAHTCYVPPVTYEPGCHIFAEC